MDIHQLSRVRHYWSSNFVLKIVIANTVTCNRFIKITEIIYINDNMFQFPKNDLNHDKIRALTNSINDNNAKIYKPSTFASIDESMIPFKGRLSLKYMLEKSTKKSYKICRADSETDYILKF